MHEPNGGLTAGGQPSHDQTKAWGPGQEAPLTPEYQKVYAESLADQAEGGEGNFFDHSARCMPGGMPLMTIAFGAMEYIEASCNESMNSSLIAIGRESYYMSADGMLMPVRKNQPPPDLRYFKQSQKR